LNDLAKSRTWAEISLSNLENNYKAIKKMISPNCRFLGVVKANAYGHGAKEIAKKLQELGADMLAVACLSEAIELRQSGILLPILCLGYTPPKYADSLLRFNIIQTVSRWDEACKLSEAACYADKKLNIHIKIDTGMTRIGFQWDDNNKSQSTEDILKIFDLPGLQVEGIFTHFANADGSENYSKMQLDRFKDAVSVLKEKGAYFKICHCAASSATLKYPDAHMDMIRAGIAMYGYPGTEDRCGLKPVMTLKSRVAAVRNVAAGAYISYGCTAQMSRDSKIAVLPIGYADGFFRGLSNQTEVIINGCRCPIVGRICMDMCMVDVTDLDKVEVGDVAVIFGEEEMAEEKADNLETIVHELLVRISPRVPRIYIDKAL